MYKSIEEIASIVKGKIVGNKDILISGFNGIQESREGDLTFLADSKYLSFVANSKAIAVVTSYDVSIPNKTIIQVDNPAASFAKIMISCIDNKSTLFEGIHEKAIISKNVKLGDNVIVGPYAVIEEGAIVGDNTIIGAGCYVGYNTEIGKDCIFYANVTLREKIFIGNQVRIHNGTVIGADGYGYVQVEGVHQKIPQIGTVVIEDNVEIGANVTIDRARFDKTVIGENSKLDNLVHIAHNCIIGKSCIIVAQCGIAGSTVIEDNCILAGQVGIVGHVTVGKNVVIASRTMVTKSLKAGAVYSGVPVSPHNEAKRINACVKRLPLYVKMIHELKSKIETLEQKLKKYIDE